MAEFAALIEFALASAGAAALATSFAKNFTLKRRVPGGSEYFSPLARRPFICTLCMGFDLGCLIWFLSNYGNTSGIEVISHGCVGAVSAWFINWKVTGRN